MKNKKLTKKLNFNKTTVANLNLAELKKLRGGIGSIVETYCEPCMILNQTVEYSSCPYCDIICITLPKDPYIPIA